MLLEKINRKNQSSCMALCMLLALTLCGCTVSTKTESDLAGQAVKDIAQKSSQGYQEEVGETREAGSPESPEEVRGPEVPEEAASSARLEEFEEICQDFYEKAAKEGILAELSAIQELVNRFGEAGYAAVDSKNQVDMTRTDQAVSFCQNAAAGEKGRFTILQVDDAGGFVQYVLQAEEGELYVDQTYFRYEGESLREKASYGYQAEEWQYTPDGYLMFSGQGFSREKYALMLGGEEEHVALRIVPLDEKCRELNREYILPAGYGRNNLFLVDWSEEAFGDLNFYDLFDLFYPMVKGQPLPYEMAENLEEGAVYRIPRQEFEEVIQTYISVDSRTLQSKTDYNPQDGTYTYRPRGFYETEYPEYPEPEVIEYRENEDGTLTLTVQAVFPCEGDTRALGHQVVIRLLEHGGVQYVSNQVLFPEEHAGEAWHTPRFTEEEWKEVYGEEE